MDDVRSTSLRAGYEREFRLRPPKTCAGGASDPALVRLSAEKLKKFHPELFGLRGLLTAALESIHSDKTVGHTLLRLREWLYHGDSRAAVVASDSPFLVASYNDEFDCVTLLRFPDELLDEYDLRVGSRLLSSNSYQPAGRTRSLARDLWDGPRSYRRHANVYPLIAEFLSDDVRRIEQRKSEIGEDEWASASGLGRLCMARGFPPRDGKPLSCGECLATGEPPGREMTF